MQTNDCRYTHTGAGVRLGEQRALQSRLCRRESRTKEFASNALLLLLLLLLYNLQPRSEDAQEGCNVVSVSGTVPSGARPLRPCCHISPPIISSRSAFSFRTHFSFPPLLLSALIRLHLCSLIASFLLIFCLNNRRFLLFPSAPRCPQGETYKLIIRSR